MKLYKLNTTYFIIAITILIIEILIATFIKEGFIRYTFGDFLASILVYCAIKSVFKINSIKIALITLVISFSIEFLQLANILKILNLENNHLLTIILGSHFSIEDLIAYSLGIICILIIDLKTTI